MDIEHYMTKHFPHVDLVPSIYEQWKGKAIHFGLGENLYQFKENNQLNLDYFVYVHKQVLALFNDLFEPHDQIILVANKYDYERLPFKKMKVYQPYVRDKHKLKQIIVKTYPCPVETYDDNSLQRQQFSLQCQVNDLRIHHLLKSVIHADFPTLKPRFGSNSLVYPDVFFVNRTKNIIMFVYDDRGCEVIGHNTPLLQSIYEKYNHWIAHSK